MARTMQGTLATAAQNQAAVAPTTKQKPTTIQGWIKAYRPEIEKALPATMTPERFTRIALTALSSNAKLGQCDPKSFLGAMLTAAQLGMEVNTPLGQAYLIPYNNQVQFQLGYKGLLDLVYRSGEVSTVYAHAVHEGDTFEYELGLEPKLIHRPAAENRGITTFYYAVFKTKDGGYGFEVMSRADIEAHAKKYSKAFSSPSSPWRTDFDAMAKKTVIKRVLKYAPMRTEVARQIAADEGVKTTLSDDMFAVANEPIEASAVVVDTNTGEVI